MTQDFWSVIQVRISKYYLDYKSHKDQNSALPIGKEIVCALPSVPLPLGGRLSKPRHPVLVKRDQIKLVYKR